MSKKIVLTAFAAAAALAVLAAPAKKTQVVMPPAVVRVGTVGETEIGEVKKYVGQVKAVDDVTLIARVSGNLIEQKVPHGSNVEKGQLLFVLEDTSYRAAVDAARAKVRQWEAELEYATSNLKRNTTLKGQNAVAQSAYEEAVRAHGTASAQLAQARAALITAEDDLQYTRVTSPVKGRMGKGMFSPGNYVTANTSKLANVVSTDPIYVDFAMSERDYLSMFGCISTTKEKADIRLVLPDNSDFKARGTVVFVNNKVDTATDTLTIRASFANPDGKLFPGGLVSVLLSRDTGCKFAAVPVTAVMTANGGTFVYVLNSENQVSMRGVKLGVIGHDGIQSVLSGLKPGETVVVDGTHKTRPGLTVKPVR